MSYYCILLHQYWLSNEQDRLRFQQVHGPKLDQSPQPKATPHFNHCICNYNLKMLWIRKKLSIATPVADYCTIHKEQETTTISVNISTRKAIIVGLRVINVLYNACYIKHSIQNTSENKNGNDCCHFIWNNNNNNNNNVSAKRRVQVSALMMSHWWPMPREVGLVPNWQCAPYAMSTDYWVVLALYYAGDISILLFFSPPNLGGLSADRCQTLPHVRYWLYNLWNWIINLGSPSPQKKKLRPKNIKTSARFRTPSRSFLYTFLIWWTLVHKWCKIEPEFRPT